MNASATNWRSFICRACGLIYDEEKGDPDSGLAAGTRFEDIPDDWECPLCGVMKSDFEPYVGFDPDGTTCASVPASRADGVVIVGGGIAGWAVAEAVRALDSDVGITLVSACHADRYHKPELSIALGRGLAPEALVREGAADAARRLGVRLLTDTFAVGLSPSLRQLRTSRGTLSFTKLVLAQGARPALPAALSPDLCWRVNDLAGWSGLHGKLKRGARRVAIVGAGMVGCELAEDFARAGHSVTLLDLQSAPLAALLPAQAGERLRSSLETLGVDFIGDTQVASVTCGDDGCKTVTTANGLQIVVDEVVAATGLVTASRIARSAGLAFERGIVVDPVSMQTSASGVYALGDCVSISGMPCRFIEPIAKQAAAIAHHLLGRPHAGYAHVQPVIRLKTKSLPIVVHGLPCPDGEWVVIEDSADMLCMQQRRNGELVARLEVGSPRHRLAA